VAAALRGERFPSEDLRTHVVEADGACAGLGELAAPLARSVQLVALGSGVDRVAAREIALKIEEGAWLPTAMRGTESCLHGHLPSCDERTGLIAIVSDPVEGSRRAERAAHALVAARRCELHTLALVDEALSGAIPAERTSLGRVELPAAGARLQALAGTAIAL